MLEKNAAAYTVAGVPVPHPCKVCGNPSHYGDESGWYCDQDWQVKFIAEHPQLTIPQTAEVQEDGLPEGVAVLTEGSNEGCEAGSVQSV